LRAIRVRYGEVEGWSLAESTWGREDRRRVREYGCGGRRKVGASKDRRAWVIVFVQLH